MFSSLSKICNYLDKIKNKTITRDDFKSCIEETLTLLKSTEIKNTDLVPYLSGLSKWLITTSYIYNEDKFDYECSKCPITILNNIQIQYDMMLDNKKCIEKNMRDFKGDFYNEYEMTSENPFDYREQNIDSVVSSYLEHDDYDMYNENDDIQKILELSLYDK